jgi:hypothetical protein
VTPLRTSPFHADAVACPVARVQEYIPYYPVASHQAACEHVSCLCPEPDCVFTSPS